MKTHLQRKGPDYIPPYLSLIFTTVCKLLDLIYLISLANLLVRSIGTSEIWAFRAFLEYLINK